MRTSAIPLKLATNEGAWGRGPLGTGGAIRQPAASDHDPKASFPSNTKPAHGETRARARWFGQPGSYLVASSAFAMCFLACEAALLSFSL